MSTHPYCRLNNTFDGGINFTEFPSCVDRFYDVGNGIYYVIAADGIYETDRHLSYCVKKNIDNAYLFDTEREIKICGVWPDGDIINSYSIGDPKENKYRLCWDEIKIDLQGQQDDVIRFGDYLWALSKNKLNIFDIQGNLRGEYGLLEEPISIGTKNNGDIWVFYSNSSVDIYSSNGIKIETLDLSLH